MTQEGFNDKIALVSGSAAGIGRATAKAFAQSGARLALADIDTERGQALVDEINKNGTQAIFYQTDMTDEQAIRDLFSKIHADFGGLDYAHNNVGLQWGRNLLDTTSTEFDKTMNLCLRSPFLCMQEEIKLMQKGNGGAIVNTASMAGVRYTSAANATYSAAKAAVIHLSAWAACEYAKDNIRVNAISPGLVSTEAVDKFMTAEQQTEHARQSQPIARAASVDEIAQSVLFLCSDRAAMITGENICISGGSQA